MTNYKVSIILLIIGSSLLVSVDQKKSDSENNTSIGAYLNGKFQSQNVTWKTQSSFSDLLFDSPIWLKKFPNSNNYLVTEHEGKVWLIQNIGSNTTKKLVLDISSQVFSKSDAGMFDIAFHPKFGLNEDDDDEDDDDEDEDDDDEGEDDDDEGDDDDNEQNFIYLVYNYLPEGLENPNKYSYHRLSRFNYSFEDEMIEKNSEDVLIQQFDRHKWHTGGTLFFDNEGFLNMSIGDEGGDNDEFNNGQSIENSLFGGIVRIDVDQNELRSHPIRRHPESSGEIPDDWPENKTQGYFIPNDNPWVSETENWLEEYFVIGLRSPHSVFYDSVKNEIWVADVGQGAREEISIVKNGSNCQWPFKEGKIDGPKSRPIDVLGDEVSPIYDYDRNVGRAIIGGFIYRGTKYPELSEKYIFGDFATQDVWALDRNNKQVTHLTNTSTSDGNLGFVSFSCGENGEIYLLQIYSPKTDKGSILELLPPDETTLKAPKFLSNVGAFKNLKKMKAANGLMSYDLNVKLYSDNAIKTRWVSIPNDGKFDSSEEQVDFSETGTWKFPPGTVFIKHFELPIDESNPEITKKIETRFLVLTEDETSYGLTYKWNEDGTDAVLLEDSDEEIIEITDLDGKTNDQNWNYPSRSQCISCHKASVGYVLGPKTHSMNKDHLNEKNGTVLNQLTAWNQLNIFSEKLEDIQIEELPRSASLDDRSASDELKVRSYLDMNCAFCHQPNGVETDFDARFSTMPDDQKIINSYANGRHSIHSNFIIKPGGIDKSEIYRRVLSTDDIKMPPIGRNLVDDKFSEVLKNYILNLGIETSIHENEESVVQIFPNPMSEDRLFIHINKTQIPATRLSVQILTMSGKLVFEKDKLPYNDIEISPKLKSGIYLVKINSGQKNEATIKLIKT